uniref:Uncharacterized protein n=1 Tax=Plectus sambesii TaxID=2011161 RepID=A0A914UQ32_9BILA
MSCIHYKFRASLEYKTLTFDGLHISVADLKREICEKENIKAESFDLVLINAQTKRVYQAEGNELIPRNSSVIVQRVPRENAMKLPKVQDRSTEGIVNRKGADPMSSSSGLGEMADFTGMTEEERLTRIKEQSTMKYHPSNYQKRVSNIMTGQPPPTYTCNRCHQPGHWFKNCPQLNARRTTGIPSEELMITTADDPQAYLHPSGKYVVPIMHRMAREMGKKEKRPFSEEETASASPSDNTSTKAAVPNELKCPLCDDLLRDAVLAVCCGDSFCDECIRSRLIESEAKQCPGLRCHQTGVSPDSLVPNIRMRQAVENFRNEAGYTYHNAASRRPMQPSSSSSSSMFMSSSSSMSSSMSAAPATTSAMADAVGQTQQAAPIVVERVRIGLPPLGSVQQKAPTTGLPPVLSNLMSQTGVTKPQSPAYQETVDQAATFRQPQPPAFHQQTLSALESEAAAQASSTPPHHSMSSESTTTTNATASSDMTGIIGMTPVEGAPLPAFLLAPPPAIGLPFGHSSNSDGVARPPLATVAPLPAALPVATVPPQVAVSHASYQSAGMASF